jgi:hypothetical protein
MILCYDNQKLHNDTDKLIITGFLDFLEYRNVNKFQNSSNSECHTLHLKNVSYFHVISRSMTINRFYIGDSIYWTIRFSAGLHLTGHYYTHTHIQ